MTINSAILQADSDDNFLDWMFEPEKKLNQFSEIKNQMKEAYLSDPYDWSIGFSGGKDSSLVLCLVWQMLIELEPSKRHKKVHVVSSDTLVETHQLSTYLHASLKMISENGKDLGIETHFSNLERSWIRSYATNARQRISLVPFKNRSDE